MFLSILHDLLGNPRFVFSMTVLWLIVSFITYKQSRIPAYLGIAGHAVLLTAPFLGVSSHGTFDLPADQILMHGIAAAFYVALFAHKPPPKR